SVTDHNVLVLVDRRRDPFPQVVLTCHFRTPVKAKRLVVEWLCSHSRKLSWSLMVDCSFDCLNSRTRPFGLAFGAPVNPGRLVAFGVQFEHLVQCVQGAR